MLPGMTRTRIAPPGLGSSSAPIPHQRSALTGSTRSSQTVSGVAAISTWRRTTSGSVVCSILLPLLSLGVALQHLQPLVPEPLEELLQLGEPLGAGAVEAPRAVPSLVHEPCLPQDGQVLRDRRPRDLEVR